MDASCAFGVLQIHVLFVQTYFTILTSSILLYYLLYQNTGTWASRAISSLFTSTYFELRFFFRAVLPSFDQHIGLSLAIHQAILSGSYITLERRVELPIVCLNSVDIISSHDASRLHCAGRWIFRFHPTVWTDTRHAAVQFHFRWSIGSIALQS